VGEGSSRVKQSSAMEDEPFLFQVEGVTVELSVLSSHEEGEVHQRAGELHELIHSDFPLGFTSSSSLSPTPNQVAASIQTQQQQNQEQNHVLFEGEGDVNQSAEEDDDEEQWSESQAVNEGAAAASSPKKKPRSRAKRARLRIDFVNYGSRGEFPQRFGRKGSLIPDGLCGKTQIYLEQWMFQLFHRRINNTLVVVEWKIINLTSQREVSRIETIEHATVRQRQGKTIANHVLKEALETRAKELEEQIALSVDNPTRVANLQSRVKALRPKTCMIGLLFFGLLHQVVQEQCK
jgi:hypothetical protein